MKQLFIIFFTASLLVAGHVKWLGNYDKALQKARDENKTLMVLLIKNDCKKCKNVVKDIFTDKEYIDKLNKHIVSVIVNIDNKHSFPIEMYWSNIYPTLFFVDSQSETFIEEPIHHITAEDVESFISNIGR